MDRFIAKDSDEAMLVSTLGPNTSFGMSAFMYSIPRSSTVRQTWFERDSFSFCEGWCWCLCRCCCGLTVCCRDVLCAQIRARERSVLWTVDRQTFEKFRDERTVDEIQSSTSMRQLRAYLKDHFLFRRMDRLGPQELNTFFLVKFRAGEEIFHQGDAHDNFYIIKSGEAERHITHPTSKEFPVPGGGTYDSSDSLAKTLGPGESFGELGLMYNSKRSATVKEMSVHHSLVVPSSGIKHKPAEAILMNGFPHAHLLSAALYSRMCVFSSVRGPTWSAGRLVQRAFIASTLVAELDIFRLCFRSMRR